MTRQGSRLIGLARYLRCIRPLPKSVIFSFITIIVFSIFKFFFALDTVIDLESWLIIPFDIQGLCLAAFVSIPLSKVPSFFPVM